MASAHVRNETVRGLGFPALNFNGSNLPSLGGCAWQETETF
jgi:hypothetical protein